MSPIVEDLKEERDEHKSTYEAAENQAKDIISQLDELESYITSERDDVDLDELVRLFHEIRELAEDI